MIRYLRFLPVLANAGAVSLLALVLSSPVAAQLDNVEGIKTKLPELKVKETIINVTPKTRFYLPSGALDLALRQDFKKTSIDFSTTYDFVDNFMGFNVDFLYDLSPLNLGVNFKDRVDFNEVFSNTQHLQRLQSMGPFAQYELGLFTSLRTGMRFENSYTDSIQSMARIEQARDILGEVGIVFDTVEEIRPVPVGEYVSCNLLHSFRNLGSDFSYTLVEANARGFVHSFGDSYIEDDFRIGYPLDNEPRPLTSYYTAGGYRLLRGYDFKEFRGNAIAYNCLTFNFPIAKTRRETEDNKVISFVTWAVFTEAAKVGDRSIFSSFADTKFSIGSGIGYRIMLFNMFPVQIELSVAKAFEQRPPRFYFTVSSIYYTWRN